ncbi:hypothetical protein SteCoe_33692 [Stentor coeruleus]|uniref:Uncharacterized protein n=1 Tax=Stentor coeruleus TaxID=5963 RepID=A0A1R2AWC7_9CILI|nr:hypothetical protein SteCoe_33692 [Stentor coeruleus]
MEDVTYFLKQIPDSCVVLQIACTQLNTFVLTTSGKVYSWGELTYALGRNPQQEKDLFRPMLIESLLESNIMSLACGTNHVLALTAEGTVYSWGDNSYGQLGLNDIKSRVVPEQIPDLKKVVRISAGNEYSFALVAKEVESVETYITFVWGNNENLKLRKVNDDDQMRSRNPVKVLMPAWGNYNPNVTLKYNKRGKNYAYKSVIGNDIELGNLTRNDVHEIETENDHLKRKLQILNKKCNEFEKDVYGCDVSLHTSGLRNDNILRNIEEVLEKTKSNARAFTVELEEKTKELKESDVKIEAIEKQLKDHLAQEQNLREQIEKDEDEIRFFHFRLDKNSPEAASDQALLSKLRADVLKNNENFTKLCSDKVELQKTILKQNQISKQINANIKKLNEEIKEANSRIKIFGNVEKIRKDQLIYNFFEQSQKGFNKELDNFQSIFEAASDTAVEKLSRSMQKNNFADYLQQSEILLNQLQGEITLMKKPVDSNFVYEELNKIWQILEMHIELMKEKNGLELGLLQETAKEVFKEMEDMENSEDRVMQRKLMKKILSKANLSQFKQTNDNV